MKNDESLAFATIEELAALLAKRKISPVELTELFLRRIETRNPALNAFLTVTSERALAAARRAEKQFLRPRSSRSGNFPLLGIPISIKDNLWTRGIRSTAGSKILRDFIPSVDSTAARKLARAGAIMIGKTNLNEFAYGITGENARARALPSRLPRACALLPSARTPAVRFAFHRHFAESSA
jgi:aspartyl-tRNA(Asn)/glutamyl-tRNA(Gln) amidotransferase subunit A